MNDFIKVSPLKLLEMSVNKALGKGNLGVLMARAGVGKTACLIHIAFDMSVGPMVKAMGPYVDSIIRLSKRINKHTAVVLQFIALAESKQIASEVQSKLHEAGFAVYHSVSRAANAISKLVQYHQRQQVLNNS